MEPTPERRRRRGGAAWLWSLLALLLLVLLVVLLVRACGDDDGNGGDGSGNAARTETQTQGSGGEGQNVGFDELVAASGASLAGWAGRQVDVADAEVQAVVGDAGFWIGPSDERSVFVEINDETGLDDRGVEEGDAVTFRGNVQENLEPETYGLRGGDAERFRRQGAHLAINAGELEIG